MVCPCRQALGDSPRRPTLTVVRGAAGQELRSGAAAFLCQINGHLDILNPLFHLGPGAEEAGDSFSEPGRERGRREGSGVRLTWPPRRRTAAGPGGSGSGAHPTRPRFPRSVGRVCIVLLPRGKWDTQCIFKRSPNWLWLKGTTKARNCFLAVPINFPLPGGGQAAPARGVGSPALGAGKNALSGVPGPGLPHGHDSSLPHLILEGGCPDISHAGGAVSRAPLREPEQGQGA